MIPIIAFDPSKITYLTRIQLNPQQEMVACVFTYDQLARLQNVRSDLTIELCNLEVDVNKPLDFAVQHAYKKGMLDLINTLITTSQDVAQTIVANQTQEAQPGEN